MFKILREDIQIVFTRGVVSDEVGMKESRGVMMLWVMLGPKGQTG